MNDRYRILKILYENQVTIGDNVFTPITQEELATMKKWSKAKVNKILNELILTLIQAQLINMNLVNGLLSSNDSGIE